MIPLCGQEVKAHEIDDKAKKRKTLIWSLRNAHVVGGRAPRLQMCDIPSLHSAEVGQDKNRVVGRDTGIDVWDHFCQGCQRQI